MIGTIIWTIFKLDNNNKNNYNYNFNHRQKALDNSHTRWLISQSSYNLMATDNLIAQQYDKKFLY